MLDGKPRSATVTAASPISVLAVPYSAFNQVLDSDPAVARNLITQLCARVRDAESR
jgi:CRP-like cAMP-binding protein